MKYLLFFLLLLPQLQLIAQTTYFSGKIVYENTFLTPVSGEDITEEMAEFYGKEQHYFIHFDSYKAFDEKDNFGQLYNGHDNKYYFLNPNTDKIAVMDASFQASKIVSITHSENTESILGKVCKQLTIKTTSDETTYFYSDEITVNPEKFSQHKLGDWSEFLKASNGALPLKYIVKNENYTWISTATSIQRMDLTRDDFDPKSLFK
ncbi:MAG: hypothetical protein ACMZ7B_10340 [Balneola sp.]